MKKLNRKGFTLIELLAIIVILAIIMVVTIPTVINSMDSAKEGQFKNAADSVAEWLEKQEEIDNMGSIAGVASPAYTTWKNLYIGKIAGSSTTGLASSSTNAKALTTELLSAAGVSDVAKNIYTFGVGTAEINSAIAGSENYVTTVKMSSNLGGTYTVSDATENITDAAGNAIDTVSSAYYNETTGRFCVELVAAAKGSFYVKDSTTKNHIKSAGC